MSFSLLDYSSWYDGLVNKVGLFWLTTTDCRGGQFRGRVSWGVGNMTEICCWPASVSHSRIQIFMYKLLIWKRLAGILEGVEIRSFMGYILKWKGDHGTLSSFRLLHWTQPEKKLSNIILFPIIFLVYVGCWVVRALESSDKSSEIGPLPLRHGTAPTRFSSTNRLWRCQRDPVQKWVNCRLLVPQLFDADWGTECNL